jgi:hypothetical protein
MRKAILALGAGLAAVLGIGLAAGPALASTPAHLTGSVALDAPDQYATFNNIGGTPSASTGSFSYTNFSQPDTAATGVWSLPKGTAIPLTVSEGAASFNHVLYVDSIEPTSQTSLSFTGHGYWADLNGPNGPIYNWTATGSIAGNQLTLHLLYTSGNPGYTATDTATINPDGSANGTATDSNGDAGLTVSIPSGPLFQALSYTAPVNSVSINSSTGDASFGSAVPAGHAYGGTPYTITVHDGGNPGVGNDTYAQNGGQFTVDGGNLTVH